MDRELQQLISILKHRGLKSGLQWLNDRVPHRWTAIYMLDNAVMTNQFIVDKKKDPDVGNLAAVPLKDSFCQFAMRDGKFVKENTGTDDDIRLDGHIYKGVLNSYVGLPLMANSDLIYGTFCHFDIEPLKISDAEFAFLQHVARLLPSYLNRAVSHVQPL